MWRSKGREGVGARLSKTKGLQLSDITEHILVFQAPVVQRVDTVRGL